MSNSWMRLNWHLIRCNASTVNGKEYVDKRDKKAERGQAEDLFKESEHAKGRLRINEWTYQGLPRYWLNEGIDHFADRFGHNTSASNC